MKRMIPVLILISLSCFGCAGPSRRAFVDAAGVNKNFQRRDNLKIVLLPTDLFGGGEIDLSAEFASVFLNAGWEVIDRSKLNDILKEQKLQLSGAIGQRAVEIGKLSGANYVLATRDLGFFNYFLGSLINVETGQIDATATCGGAGKTSSCVLNELVRLTSKTNSKMVMQNEN